MSALKPCGVCGCVPLATDEAAEVEKLRAELAAVREALRIAIEALDAADMPHTADAIRTVLGDTP